MYDIIESNVTDLSKYMVKGLSKHEKLIDSSMIILPKHENNQTPINTIHDKKTYEYNGVIYKENNTKKEKNTIINNITKWKFKNNSTTRITEHVLFLYRKQVIKAINKDGWWEMQVSLYDNDQIPYTGVIRDFSTERIHKIACDFLLNGQGLDDMESENLAISLNDSLCDTIQ